MGGYGADSFTSGSGSSNTTKTNSTDNSSRHSAASTAPSSADLNGQDDWRLHTNKRSLTDAPQQPPLAKPGPSGFLKSAGRSWSFGASKKQLPAVPAGDEDVPITPAVPEQYRSGRARATTSSTDATVTPPKVDQDLSFDLGGSFSKMLLGFDKRSSVMTLKDENGRQVLQPPAATAGRLNAPSPIHIDHTSKVEPPPHSWASHHSNDNLLTGSPRIPSPTKENTPPPVPAHGEPQSSRPRGPGHSSSENLLKRTSAIFSGRRKSINNALETGEGDDLNTSLLAVNRFMSDANSRSQTPVEVVGGRYRRNEDTSGPGYRVVSPPTVPSKLDPVDDDDNMFDTVPLNSDRFNTPRQPAKKPAPKPVDTPAKNKTMTVSEFEQYRKDKEVEERRAEVDKARDGDDVDDEEDEDEINYDDDEDEAEKSKQLAKQRRKQEAHMTVYRQQMMKVTGESPDAGPSRPSMQMSLSAPNLVVPEASRNSSSEVSEDDEEVPLAILAAHGFPNKNRPPTRLTNMMSNPNLRQAAQPSFQRPGSAAGHAPTASGSLPPFARGLPQDPYGLVNAPPRESFALGGGVPAGQNSPVPPGGLVGVIANEERSRAMRRGSPQVAQMPMDPYQGMQQAGPGGFDPVQGIPQQMMYPQQPPMPMLSPNEQAQLQLNQQMSQFMQMQMQFMQMMAGNNGGGGNNVGNGPPRSAGHMGSNSMGAVQGMGGPGMGMGMGMPMGMDMNAGARGSYLETPMMDQTMGQSMGDMHGRTMSMVQPSSSSWLQPPQPGYAGSIRQQGNGYNGYTPSIAPSERSNVGLPGRYRPVSQMPPGPGTPDHTRQSSMMASTVSPYSDAQTLRPDDKMTPKKSEASKSAGEDADDDDEEGWAAMKAKRDKKKSSWKMRKTMAPGGLDIGSLIT